MSDLLEIAFSVSVFVVLWLLTPWGHNMTMHLEGIKVKDGLAKLPSCEKCLSFWLAGAVGILIGLEILKILLLAATSVVITKLILRHI